MRENIPTTSRVLLLPPIPKSLKEAIGAFLLACAIKDIRRIGYLIEARPWLNAYQYVEVNDSTVSISLLLVDTCLDEYGGQLYTHIN